MADDSEQQHGNRSKHLRRRLFLLSGMFAFGALPIALRWYFSGVLGRRQFPYEFAGPFGSPWTKQTSDVSGSPVEAVRLSVSPSNSKVEYGFRFAAKTSEGSQVQPEVVITMKRGGPIRVFTEPLTKSSNTGYVYVKGTKIPRVKNPYMTVSRKFPDVDFNDIQSITVSFIPI